MYKFSIAVFFMILSSISLFVLSWLLVLGIATMFWPTVSFYAVNVLLLIVAAGNYYGNTDENI